LIQQWLKEVVIPSIDERHPDRLVAEASRATQPRESTAQNYHVR
jgi:hypothetical protein